MTQKPLNINDILREFRLMWGYDPSGAWRYKKGKELEYFIETSLRRSMEAVKPELISKNSGIVPIEKDGKQVLEELEQNINNFLNE